MAPVYADVHAEVDAGALPVVLPPQPYTDTVPPVPVPALVILPPSPTYTPWLLELAPAPPPVPSTSTAPPLEVICALASLTLTPVL